MKIYSTITELSHAMGHIGQCVSVLGSEIINDGGGGFFYWDETSVALDDGINIIKILNLTDGRWIRIGDFFAFRESEITGTNIDFTVNGARFKDITADTTLTVSNLIPGKEVLVQINNTDTNTHNVTIMDVSFPDDTNNTIPAGGRARIRLIQINGILDAEIKIYS